MSGDCATWKKVDGRWQCRATQCDHWSEEGCTIGKISMTCDNTDCKWNIMVIPGIYRCSSMDAHLDADGRCLGIENKRREPTNV